MKEQQQVGFKEESHNDYHSSEGVSRSELTSLFRSPKHLHYYLGCKPKETKAMNFGTAFHSFCLEDDWKEHIAIMPKIDARTKVGKELKASFIEKNQGKTIIDEDEYHTLVGMKEALMEHDSAKSFITREGAIKEKSCYWMHQDGGDAILCKCRPDIITPQGVMVDLKTTDDASEHTFMKSIIKYRYDLQAAFYLDGWNKAQEQSGTELTAKAKAFVFVAVEKKPPYAVAVYRLDPEDISFSRKQYIEKMREYMVCIKEDYYPAYGDKIKTIGLPDWFKEEK